MKRAKITYSSKASLAEKRLEKECMELHSSPLVSMSACDPWRGGNLGDASTDRAYSSPMFCSDAFDWTQNKISSDNQSISSQSCKSGNVRYGKTCLDNKEPNSMELSTNKENASESSESHYSTDTKKVPCATVTLRKKTTLVDYFKSSSSPLNHTSPLWNDVL